jgi:hypothetical protein
VSGALILGYETVRVGSIVRRLADHPTAAAYLAPATILSAVLVTFLVMVVRELRRAKRSEMAGYRQALETGQVSGDVSRGEPRGAGPRNLLGHP